MTGMTWWAMTAVAGGAALGAWSRWALGELLNSRHPLLPLGTLAANLIGGYLVGLAVAWFGARADLSPILRPFMITGFLWALTTFSTFSSEFVALRLRGDYGHAGALAALHLFGSLALTAAGIATFRSLTG